MPTHVTQLFVLCEFEPWPRSQTNVWGKATSFRRLHISPNRATQSMIMVVFEGCMVGNVFNRSTDSVGPAMLGVAVIRYTRSHARAASFVVYRFCMGCCSPEHKNLSRISCTPMLSQTLRPTQDPFNFPATQGDKAETHREPVKLLLFGNHLGGPTAGSVRSFVRCGRRRYVHT